MSDAILRAVHTDKQLTQMSIAYSVELENLISAKNPARINVSKQTDFYYIWSKEDLFRIVADETPAGAETPGGKVDLTKDTFICTNIGLHEDIHAEEIANQDDSLELETNAVEYVTKNILLKDEKKFFDTIYKPGVWTGSTTGADLVGGTDFTQFNVPGADPVLMIDLERNRMMETTGMKPNTIIVDPATYAYLRSSDDLKDRIKYTQKGFLNEELLAQAFDVEYFWVSYSTRNTAAKGATESMEFFAPEYTMWLGYVENRPGLRKPSAFYTFWWEAPLKVAGANYRNNMGVGMRSYYMQNIDSLRVEGKVYTGYKVTAPDLGIFFTNTVDTTPAE